MRVESFEPSARLHPYVRAIRVIESNMALIAAPLPEAGLVLGVRYAGRASVVEHGVPRALPDALLTGIEPALRRIHTDAGGGLAVAVFKAGGAARFFDGSLYELFGTMVDLAALTGRNEVDRLRARLAEADTSAARAAILDAYLCSRLGERRADALVLTAASAIDASGGRVRITSLSRGLGLSVDRFEKRFRAVVGASPKQLASIVRFRRAIASYSPGLRLTQLAHDAGYFDQSHLIRDFRAVTGLAPRDFLRSPDYWG
jgi:methylphosphotriester-DNA--protein-cysteine methyltransferase